MNPTFEDIKKCDYFTIKPHRNNFIVSKEIDKDGYERFIATVDGVIRFQMYAQYTSKNFQFVLQTEINGCTFRSHIYLSKVKCHKHQQLTMQK